MDENIDPKTKLHGGGCVQDACDPFVLPRYCVSSGMATMSKNIRIGGNIKPLGQYNLSEGGDEREVHGLDERGFIAPVTSESTI